MGKCNKQIAYSGHDRLHQAREVLCGDDGVLCGGCVKKLEAALKAAETAGDVLEKRLSYIGRGLTVRGLIREAEKFYPLPDADGNRSGGEQ